MVILDACIVIAFGNAGQFDLIAHLQAHQVCIGERAAAEVTRPPAFDALTQAFAAGMVGRETIDLANPTEQDALARFDSLPAFTGRGDAEVLALALTRGYVIGSDDTAVRSHGVAALGSPQHLAGSLDFLRWAVREDRLAIQDGHATLAAIDPGGSILAVLTRRGQKLEDVLR